MSSNSYPFPVYGASREVTGPRIAALAAFAVALIAFLSVFLGGGSDGSGAAAPATQPVTRAAGATASKAEPAAAAKPAAKPKPKRTVVPAPSATPVMVLNANGAAGAASGTATRLRGYGYATPVVTNAKTMGIPTQIQYAPGFGAAARALERRLGGVVRYVGPLDGIRREELRGAKLVLVVGT